MERALRRLPAKQRSVIKAVGVDGKSYEEVAQALGISVGAVRCHLARARERLRAAVNGDRYTVAFTPRLAPVRLPTPPASLFAPASARDALPALALAGDGKVADLHFAASILTPGMAAD